MIKIVAQNGQVAYDVYEYVVDTYSDIETIPARAGAGSSALVIDSSLVYMKNNKGKWILLDSSSGGGSGSGGNGNFDPSANYITEEELITEMTLSEDEVLNICQ